MKQKPVTQKEIDSAYNQAWLMVCLGFVLALFGSWLFVVVWGYAFILTQMTKAVEKKYHAK